MSTELIEYIKRLIPLCDIRKEQNLQDLYKNILLGKMPAGKTLFHSGEQSEFTYYLLAGQISLTDTEGNQSHLSAEDPRCRFPVGYDQAQRYTVTTDTNINYIKIKSETLDRLLTWDQTTTPLIRHPQVRPTDSDQTSWMSIILESPLFQRIPPVNIQAMFLRFDTIQAQQDELIIEQGEEADYYYVIKSGRCAVFRTTPDRNSSPQKIAELGPGASFGEEALVADSVRNATVVMQKSGELARLSKTDFLELLKAPVVQAIDYQHALEQIAEGARFLDVRTVNEYCHNHLPDSLNIPLNTLRENFSSLDNNLSYIVYCDTGGRSAAACFLLNERGFRAYLLDHGLNKLPSDAILHPDKN